MRWLPRPSKWQFYMMWAVVHTIGRMPLRWRYGISRFMSDRVYDWGPRIGPNIRDNVRHVLGPDASDEEVDRIARKCARNTGRYYADVVGMHRMDVQKFLRDDLILEGFEYITEARAAGHGVVLASGHYANPEFALQALAAMGMQAFALVEPLDPPELDRLMRGLRTVHGHIWESVSVASVKHAMQWLRAGGVVAILVDRDIQKRGIVLNFCGAPARFPTGAVDLALRTNSVLLPGFCRREGGYKIRATLGPPMPLVVTGDRDTDLRVNTQNLIARFEKHLKEDPGQWSVLDRIWPADLAPAAPRPPADEPDAPRSMGDEASGG